MGLYIKSLNGKPRILPSTFPTHVTTLRTQRGFLYFGNTEEADQLGPLLYFRSSYIKDIEGKERYSTLVGPLKPLNKVQGFSV